MNPMDRSAARKAVIAVVDELKKISKPCTTSKEISQVGDLGQRDEAIGKTIAEAMDKVGKEGGSPSRTARASRTSSTWSRACSSTAATSRRTSSTTLTSRPRSSRIRTSCCTTRRSATSATCSRTRAGGEVRQALLIIAEDADGRRSPRWWSQHPRHPEDRGREGAGLRRPTQGNAGRHRDPDRRHGDRRRARAKLENATPKDLGRAKKTKWRRKTRRSSTARAKARSRRVKNIRTRSRRRRRTRQEKLQERVAKPPAAWR